MEEQAKPWKVKTVVAVEGPHLKRDWLPEVKQLENVGTFFKFNKFDRSIVMALTGKGLRLEASKDPHLLSHEEFGRIVKLRNEKCTEVYQQTMRAMAQRLGEEWKPSKAQTHAKTEHRLICSLYVTITLPAVQTDDGSLIGPLEVGWL